jgi:hypothetical protein
MNHSCAQKIDKTAYEYSLSRLILVLDHMHQSNLNILYLTLSNAVIFLCEKMDKSARPCIFGEVLFGCTSDSTLILVVNLLKKFLSQIVYSDILEMKEFMEILNRCLAKHGSNRLVHDVVKELIFKCVSTMNSSEPISIHCFNELNLVQPLVLEALRCSKGNGVYRKTLLPRRVPGKSSSSPDALAEIKRKLKSHDSSGVSDLSRYVSSHSDFDLDGFLSEFTSFQRRLILRRLSQ